MSDNPEWNDLVQKTKAEKIRDSWGIQQTRERRRYALLQAAATIISGPDEYYVSVEGAVTTAEKLLAEIERRET